MDVNVDITNFTHGEASPRLKGRTDLEHYFSALDTEFNMVTMPQGGATRRPGTLMVALAKDQNPTPFRVRNLPFNFGKVQAYHLELAPGFIRVYMNDAAVVNNQNVTGAANNGSGLIRLAVTSTANLVTGGTVNVASVTGTTEANGTWTYTLIDGTHVDLQGSAFAHAYVSGGLASFNVDIAVPYAAADIPAVKITQSADTLFMCHPKYPTAALRRSSHTAWSYTALTFFDGPYLPVNGTTTTLTSSVATGSGTLTASSTVGINGGQGFLASDVGRLVRINTGATVTPGGTISDGGAQLNGPPSTPATGTAAGGGWGWLVITGFTDSTHVSITVQALVSNGGGGAIGTTAALAWRMGKWSATTGYPYAPAFWQQRLMLLGTDNQPNAAEGSVTGDFTNFAPTQADGSVTGNNAVSWVISDDQVNAIRAVSPAGSAQAMQLGIFTDGCEDVMQAATTSQALTSTNVQVYRETSYGAAPNVPVLRIGKSVLFADVTGRKLREWTFFWQVNGYLGTDLTKESEHLTRGASGSQPSTWGIRTMCYQQSPYQVVWLSLNNGGLVSATYDRDEKVFAPSRHQLGGQYFGGAPIVESICCIPSPDATYDELWLVVLRTIAGVPTRFIEVMTRYFDAMPQDTAFFVDAGLSTALVTPAFTLTPPASGLTDTSLAGQAPAFTGTGTWTASGAAFAGTSADVGKRIRCNGGMAEITAAIDTSHATAQVLKPLANLATASSGAWSVTAKFTTVSGLGYANGETVAILGDGAVFQPQAVANAQVSLQAPGASLVTAGFPYTPVLVTMPFEPIRAVGAATQGKVKRVKDMYLRLHETLGLNFGRRITDEYTKHVEDKVEPLQSRSAADPMGQPPPLFSGMRRLPMPGGYDTEGQIIITQTEPLPLTVLAISALADVGDMPQPGQ